MEYLYPDNLKSKATLWLWQLRDILFISVGALISIFAFAQTRFFLPLILTSVYAFLSIRFDDISILNFLKYSVKYFFLKQQEFNWR